MAIGMSQQEFWDGDPRLAKAYMAAHRIRRGNAYADQWVAGIYVMRAVQAALMGDKAPYPDKPLVSVGETAEEREERERMEHERMTERMKARFAELNARFAPKEDQ